MGNTRSYYPCQEQAPSTHGNDDLTITTPKHKVEKSPVVSGYVPSSDAIAAFNSLEQEGAVATPVLQASEDLNDLNSIITIDLLNFDLTFPCPLCAAIGDNVQLTVISLSDHVSRHKYEQLLAEKTANTRVGVAEMNSVATSYEKIKRMVQFPRTRDDKSSEETSDEQPRTRDDKLITGRQFWNTHEKPADLNDESAYNLAIRESARENELMGSLSEDDALAAAIAASVELAKPEHNTQQPIVVVPSREPARPSKRQYRIEANGVENVEVDCD